MCLVLIDRPVKRSVKPPFRRNLLVEDYVSTHIYPVKACITDRFTDQASSHFTFNYVMQLSEDEVHLTKEIYHTGKRAKELTETHCN